MTKYQFFKHKYKSNFSLVLKEGADFPSEGNAEDWLLVTTRHDSDVNDQTKSTIEDKGYCLTKMEVSFTEVSN